MNVMITGLKMPKRCPINALIYPDGRAIITLHSGKKMECRAEEAADVRPVVLCRECKHNKGERVWQFLDLEDVTADCSAGHGYPSMDWFCADGEKREEI